MRCVEKFAAHRSPESTWIRGPPHGGGGGWGRIWPAATYRLPPLKALRRKTRPHLPTGSAAPRRPPCWLVCLEPGRRKREEKEARSYDPVTMSRGKLAREHDRYVIFEATVLFSFLYSPLDVLKSAIKYCINVTVSKKRETKPRLMSFHSRFCANFCLTGTKTSTNPVNFLTFILKYMKMCADYVRWTNKWKIKL